MAHGADEQPDIFRHTDRTAFVRAVAGAVSDALRNVLASKPRARLAVPGGRTVGAIIPVLAAEPLPWDRIDVTLVDERWVPPNHPDSNERQIRELFTGVPAAAIRGLFVVGLDLQDALHRLATMPPPDVVLLSMAEDGHIGSLFPGDPANNADARFAVVTRPDHIRVTMTPRSLQAAGAVVLAVEGQAKALLLLSALDPTGGGELPVRHVMGAGTCVHIGLY
jgi:6-phosphogluconolactonase